MSLSDKKRLVSRRIAVRLRVACKQDWTCAICKKLLPSRFHVDHIVPLSQGGHDREKNLQVLCPACHDKKTELEVERCWSIAREKVTGRSKYFNPSSIFYLEQ